LPFVIFWCRRVTVLLGMSVLLTGCSPHKTAARVQAPEIRLQSVPQADPAQYDQIQDMKKWRNPYLIVRADGVALYDSADSAEIIVKPQDVIPELSRLPASNWPYGRVVAATENAADGSDQNGVAMRRNKGIVGGLLASAHVAIRWVPGT